MLQPTTLRHLDIDVGGGNQSLKWLFLTLPKSLTWLAEIEHCREWCSRA
jgi:hypothetical protein